MGGVMWCLLTRVTGWEVGAAEDTGNTPEHVNSVIFGIYKLSSGQYFIAYTLTNCFTKLT